MVIYYETIFDSSGIVFNQRWFMEEYTFRLFSFIKILL